MPSVPGGLWQDRLGLGVDRHDALRAAGTSGAAAEALALQSHVGPVAAQSVSLVEKISGFI